MTPNRNMTCTAVLDTNVNYNPYSVWIYVLFGGGVVIKLIGFTCVERAVREWQHSGHYAYIWSIESSFVIRVVSLIVGGCITHFIQLLCLSIP